MTLRTMHRVVASTALAGCLFAASASAQIVTDYYQAPDGSEVVWWSQPFSGSPGVVIDQSQLVVRQAISDTWTDRLAQTFITNANNVSGGGFFLHNQWYRDQGPGLNPWLTIELWDGNPGLGGIRLTGGSVSNAPVNLVYGNEWAWAQVFWSPVSVTPGRTYWLVEGNGAPGWALVGNVDYPDGNVCYESESWVCRSGPSSTFVTFTTEVVPEPATMTLLATGLAGMAAAARRRQKKA